MATQYKKMCTLIEATDTLGIVLIGRAEVYSGPIKPSLLYVGMLKRVKLTDAQGFCDFLLQQTTESHERLCFIMRSIDVLRKHGVRTL